MLTTNFTIIFNNSNIFHSTATYSKNSLKVGNNPK